MKKLLEIAVFNYISAEIAAKAGVDRIELCKDYISGGLSPDISDLKKYKKQFEIPVFVMIRPRPGNFTYTSSEIQIMCSQIEEFKNEGADGFVLGCLDETGNLDIKHLEKLQIRVGNYPVTFHRAIDAVRNTEAAIEKLIELGVQRILTSGTFKTAEEGKNKLAEWNKTFENQIVIMPGGGIRSHNLKEIKLATGLNEFHSAALDLDCMTADAAEIKRLKSALQD